MIFLVGLLALALILQTALFVRYLGQRDRREWDERSELLARIQSPQVLNPRALQEPFEPPEPPPPDYRGLAGTISETEMSVPNGSG